MKYIFLFIFFLFSISAFAQDSLFLRPISEYKIEIKVLRDPSGLAKSHGDCAYTTYEMLRELRARNLFRIDSIIKIVKTANANKADSIYYFVQLIESWDNWTTCDHNLEYVSRYVDPYYCVISASIEKQNINKLQGILDKNEVYYYSERKIYKEPKKKFD